MPLGPVQIAANENSLSKDDDNTGWDEVLERDPDGGCIEVTDDEAEGPEPESKIKGHFVPPPSIEEVRKAFQDLGSILKPCRKNANGFKDPGFDRIVIERLSGMKLLCHNYAEMHERNLASSQWIAASLLTAKSLGSGPHLARSLRKWIHAFISDSEFIPEHYHKGKTGHSLIDDEDFAQELHLYLQSVGEYCTTQDIIRYIAQPEILIKLNRTKTISHATAHRWMQKMRYRWSARPQGQYVDGHERPDVVEYRRDVFLPAMKKLEAKIRKWGLNGEEESSNERRTVIWYHDESTFYAHDRQKKRWVHKSEKATPYAKGEGHSLMIADFVSADYGWLQSPDGKESTRVIFKAGKNRDGYFDNKNIRTQAAHAMEILTKHYPDEDHVLVFDNATTHLKRAEDSLSASKMPKGPSKNFFIEIDATDERGKPIYGPDGKILKRKVPMANGKFKDSTEQLFYYPEGHKHAGQFKGMAKILEERGYQITSKKAQCGKKFTDCPDGSVTCCCRRMLYNEPDFKNVDSILEADVKAHGFQILFLPKFHCELNFIEQCWGHAKRRYRTFPHSSKEDILEKNVIEALDEVPLISMRRSVLI